jgi:hypothetical protein
MDCPKCGFPLDSGFSDCPRCGIVIAKFLRAHEESLGAVELPPLLHTTDAVGMTPEDESAARSERIARAVAIPLALLFAWLAVKGSPGAVRMLGMWVHESGHAVTAWLCGYLAWPGPWCTPVATERSPSFTVLIVGGLAFGAYRAWQLQRWFWITASACTLLLVLFCTLILRSDTAQQLIVFGGDGGALVLGTMLMLTVYAREEHPIRRDHLRWGLLVIGALAFMDVYAVWSGPSNRLPFGENENGLSDPSVLTELYGWGVPSLVNRYSQLAHACLTLLLIVYLAAIYSRALTFSTSTRARLRLQRRTDLAA